MMLMAAALPALDCLHVSLPSKPTMPAHLWKGAEGTILGTPRGHPVGESVQHFFSKARVKLMLMAAALPCLRLFICVSGCLSSPRYLPSWGKLAMHAFLVCLNDSNGSSHACSWLYVCQIVFALASMCARLSMLLPLCVPDSHCSCLYACQIVYTLASMRARLSMLLPLCVPD
eukprot:567055-Pelagomonas_calceolata.AAC.1